MLTPEIKEHFGLDLAGVALLTAVILPVGILIELPIAYLADRWNRTRMAAFGALIWAIFTVLTGFAGITTSLLTLYIARGGSALGKTFNATHNSLLADYYPQESRARVFYAHRLANSVGQFIGPLAAGFLAAAFFWELPFFILAAPTIFFVLFALRLKEPLRGVHERLAAGADEDTAQIEEAAAGFSETFRVLFARQSAAAHLLRPAVPDGLGSRHRHVPERLLRRDLQRELGRARRDLRHDRARADRSACSSAPS